MEKNGDSKTEKCEKWIFQESQRKKILEKLVQVGVLKHFNPCSIQMEQDSRKFMTQLEKSLDKFLIALTNVIKKTKWK